MVGGDEDDRPSRGDSETDEHSLFPKDAVHKQADAFTWYLLKLAAEDGRVKQFRQRVLNGGTISYGESEALLRSPAAAVFSCSWFEERGIPFVGHKAQVLEGEWPPSEESSGVRGTMKIGWEGGELCTPFEAVPPFRSLEVFLHAEGRLFGHLR
jgi:hypothetical protein